MTDYTTLTDAEINKRVALTCGWVKDETHYDCWRPTYTETYASPLLNFAEDLNACFGPYGPARWLLEHGFWHGMDGEGIKVVRRYAVSWSEPPLAEVQFRDIPNREARAFCEAFLAVVETE